MAWDSTTARWSALTSGTTRGTSGAMRKAEELEMTAQPAAAKRGSRSRAMGASMEEKMMRGRSGPAASGVLGWRTICAMRAGRGVSRRQAQASA